MKLKNLVFMAASAAIIGMTFAGCGGSPQSGQGTQQGTSQSGTQGTQQDNAQSGTQGTQQDASQSGTQGTKQDTSVQEGETGAAGNTAQGAETYEDNYAVDSKAAKGFAEKVKDAVAQKDLEALAELTAFPVYVGLPDVNVVETKEDFLKLGAETVFTEKLLESIGKADIEDLQPSRAGFSISDGGTANINFGVSDGVLAISGINY